MNKKYKKDRKEAMKNCKVKDCSNCIFNIDNRKCEVMRKLLWDEECFAWASAKEAIKREEAIMNYSIYGTEACKQNIEKYKRKAVANGCM